MSPLSSPFPSQQPAKRNELKTYSELGLGRHYKSARQRRRLAGGGPRLLIGGDDPARPQLVVERTVYSKTRLDVLRALLVRAREELPGVGREFLLDHLGPRVERETYDRLAAVYHHAPRLDAAFRRLHGRQPTLRERESFAPPGPRSVKEEPAEWGAAAEVPFARYRGGVLDELMGQIQARQAHNPDRYQTVWAELVGPELAQQSRLEKIVPESATAFFRCFNSALYYQLQRRADLPGKLARALKVPVRQLKVLY